MLSVLDNYTLDNPDEIAKEIANDFRKRRIEKNLTREQTLHLMEYYHPSDVHYNISISDDRVFFPMENKFLRLLTDYLPLS